MGFTRAQLEAARDRLVDDLLGPGLRLLFVGINPGLWTAAANAHFARPGNRFWPALHLAGITPTLVDASAGMPPDAAADLMARGVGITNLVARATARADEVKSDELRVGGERLAALVVERAPAVVAVLGLTAYRTAFGDRRASAGPQAAGLGDAALWVLPNPSGLNAHETVGSLAAAYRRVAEAAGIRLEPGST
jgi:double-stranded uracil-DNA glycosylase